MTFIEPCLEGFTTSIHLLCLLAEQSRRHHEADQNNSSVNTSKNNQTNSSSTATNSSPSPSNLSLVSLGVALDAFVGSLAKFTSLHSAQKITEKHLKAIDVLVNISLSLGNSLRGCWPQVADFVDVCLFIYF